MQEEFDLSEILSESIDAAAKSKADLLADIDIELQVKVLLNPHFMSPEQENW